MSSAPFFKLTTPGHRGTEGIKREVISFGVMNVTFVGAGVKNLYKGDNVSFSEC